MTGKALGVRVLELAGESEVCKVRKQPLLGLYIEEGKVGEIIPLEISGGISSVKFETGQ